MDPITLLILAGMGITAGIGSITDTINAKKATQQQIDLTHEQMEWQEYMYQLQRADQASNLRKVIGANADAASIAHNRQVALMNLQSELNSPERLVQQYRNAGFNPYVAMAGGTTQGVSSQSSPSPSLGVPSVPSVGSVGMPSIHPAPSIASGLLNHVEQIAQMYKTVKEADKSGAETQEIKTLLTEKLRDFKLKNDYQEHIQPLLAISKLRTDAAQIGVLSQQAVLLSEQGKTEQADQALKKMQTLAEEMKAKCSKKQAELVDLEISTYMMRVKSEVNLNNAKAREANANFNKANEEADAQRFDNMQTWDAMQQGINKYVDEHYNVHADILLKRENRALAHQFISKAVAETIGHQLSNQEQAMINAATPELLANNIELVRSHWRKNESDINKNFYEMQREAVQMTIQGLVGMIIGLKGFGGNFHIKGFAQ